jgi:hypothetical protein
MDRGLDLRTGGLKQFHELTKLLQRPCGSETVKNVESVTAMTVVDAEVG